MQGFGTGMFESVPEPSLFMHALLFGMTGFLDSLPTYAQFFSL